MRSCFPLLYKAEQRGGSVLLGLLLGRLLASVAPPSGRFSSQLASASSQGFSSNCF